jgi:hypothetical protein
LHEYFCQGTVQYVQVRRFWLPNPGGLVAVLRCLDRSLKYDKKSSFPLIGVNDHCTICPKTEEKGQIEYISRIVADMLTPVFVDQILEQYGRSCDDSGSRTAVTSCVTRELHLLIVLKKNEFSHLPLSDILNLFQPSQISPISVVCTSTSSQHRSLKLPHLPSPQFPNGKLLMITYNQTRFTRICCSLTLQDSSWWNSLSQMFYRQMLGVDMLYHQCLYLITFRRCYQFSCQTS